jgi:hypothetical protein
MDPTKDRAVTVNFRERLTGACAAGTWRPYSAPVELDELLARFILFKTYILESARIEEIDHLFSVLGHASLLSLLRSGAFEIDLTYASIAYLTKVDEGSGNERPLPSLYYAFRAWRPMSWASLREQRIKECVSRLPDLSARQREQLEEGLDMCVLTPRQQAGDEAIEQLHTELALDSPPLSVRKAIAFALSDTLGRQVKLTEFALTIHRPEPTVFAVETNIDKMFALSTQQTHETIGSGLMALGRVNYRLEVMHRVNALTGFDNDDLAIWQGKLGSVFEQARRREYAAEATSERLTRVLELKGFPALGQALSKGRIDIARLLEVRNDPKIDDFRRWLASVHDVPDEELAARLNDLRGCLGGLADSRSGKVVRFVVTTGVGLVPGIGTIAGALLGGLDMFVLEKLLGKPGPVSFMNRTFSRIYRKGQSTD